MKKIKKQMKSIIAAVPKSGCLKINPTGRSTIKLVKLKNNRWVFNFFIKKFANDKIIKIFINSEG